MTLPPPTPQQARLIWLALSGLALGVLVGLLGLLLWLLSWALKWLSPVLWPLAIGGILAYLLDPVVESLVRRNMPRRRAVLWVFVLCAVVLLAFFGSVVPRLVRETGRLASALPRYSRVVQEDMNRWMSSRPFFETWRVKLFPGAVTNWPAATNLPAPSGAEADQAVLPVPSRPVEHAWTTKVSERLLEWASGALPQVGRWLLAQVTRVASWAGTLISLALAPVFTYYFLAEKHGIVESWTKYLPVRESRFKEELIFVITAINNYLITFFRGQVVVALCLGGLLTIGFLAIGLDYAVLLGMLAGVLNIVPYLGAILTIIPAVGLAAVEFRDWLHPVLVLGIFALVQTAEGLVISPRIMGGRVGLHPLTIIIALMVGATLLGGILGGILAIPLTAALRVLMFRYVWKRQPVQAIAL